MKFYMHQRIIGENLIKIGLILSAQWRFSEERYQACPVTLNVPPGARAKSQMTPVECKKTKTIANLPIHVKQAINRIKEFKILKNIMSINMLPLVNDIVQVSGALCNLQPSLIKSRSK